MPPGSVMAMRVLVVEDEKKTASFIRKALQTEGCAVDVLHDGGVALAAVEKTPVDVVVLDVMLPGRDGLSVVRQMRERKIAVPDGGPARDHGRAIPPRPSRRP